jgi:hypothetical protein
VFLNVALFFHGRMNVHFVTWRFKKKTVCSFFVLVSCCFVFFFGVRFRGVFFSYSLVRYLASLKGVFKVQHTCACCLEMYQDKSQTFVRKIKNQVFHCSRRVRFPLDPLFLIKMIASTTIRTIATIPIPL